MSPMNKNIKPFVNDYIDRRGQVPLTEVKDLEQALTVKVQSISGVDCSLIEFTSCGHAGTAPNCLATTKEEAIKGILSGTALWQGLETIHIKVKVTGCTRIFTHQLVRQRIGITFSQQCSGESDWRHHNILVLRTMNYPIVIHGALSQKKIYADLLDAGNHLHEARYNLPHCLETFIYFDASLATIRAIYAKRICTMTQTWEMILFARKLKEAIVQEAPYLEKAFFNPCEAGTCWYQSAREGKEETFLYQPDKVHDRFDWHPDSFLYNGTCEEISTGCSPVLTSRYYGKESVVTELRWQKLREQVESWR